MLELRPCGQSPGADGGELSPLIETGRIGAARANSGTLVQQGRPDLEADLTPCPPPLPSRPPPCSSLTTPATGPSWTADKGVVCTLLLRRDRPARGSEGDETMTRTYPEAGQWHRPGRSHRKARPSRASPRGISGVATEVALQLAFQVALQLALQLALQVALQLAPSVSRIRGNLHVRALVKGWKSLRLLLSDTLDTWISAEARSDRRSTDPVRRAEQAPKTSCQRVGRTGPSDVDSPPGALHRAV